MDIMSTLLAQRLAATTEPPFDKADSAPVLASNPFAYVAA
jgi:hypothetical protein